MQKFEQDCAETDSDADFHNSGAPFVAAERRALSK